MSDNIGRSVGDNPSGDESLSPNEIAYRLIQERDWDALKRMIRDGFEEDFKDCDYKDEPLIFDVMDAGAGDVACYWLAHGYPAKGFWGKSNYTIAHNAAFNGQPEVLRLLVKLGVEVDAKNKRHETPLRLAAASGCVECVKILLAAGADPDGQGKESGLARHVKGRVPLAAAKYPEVAKTLIRGGADPNFEESPSLFPAAFPSKIKKFFPENAIAPLSAAILENRDSVAKVLLEAGAAPNCLNGQPLRCFAAARQDGWSFDDLVKAGANPDGVEGAEPLRIAALMGNEEICDKLLKAGAIPIPDALRLSAGSGNIGCASLFLKHGIGDPSEAAFEAARLGDEEMLYCFLGRFQNIGRGIALHGAIEGCQLDLALALLKNGADPNARDYKGRTPLALLYSHDRQRKTFRYSRVLERKQDESAPLFERRWPSGDKINDPGEGTLRRMDSRRPKNWNEIIERLEVDTIGLAKELIARGGDVSAKDYMGRSVLWRICKNVWIKSASWFLEMGESLDDRDLNGVSAFEAGCLSGDADIIESMLKSGYDPNTPDANGDTALHKCARAKKQSAGYSSAIFKLLRSGADPDLKNNKGESVRKLATVNKDLAHTLERAEKFL